MPKIYDNIEIKLKDGLNNTLATAYRADFCIGYFNLRGWNQVSRSVEDLEGSYLPEESEDDRYYYARALVGMQRLPEEELRILAHNNEPPLDNKKANEMRRKVARSFREQLIIGAPSNADEQTLKRLQKQLKSGKLCIKLHLRNTLHAKLYLAHRSDFNTPLVGFVGSSNLTFSGISKQGELNVDVVEGDAAKKLSNWFEDRWADKWSIDITQELIEILDESWASEKLIPPYHIYLKIAYQLSREARAGISEFKLPAEFINILLPYQQSAVKVAAHHLHKRDGVIIGDVVGLGKTITAVALARIFEDDFFLETLIICPKNLERMWEDYAHKYRLRAKVMPITKVQSQLHRVRRYRLMIIDESHNLRNKNGKRYRAIQEYVQLNGCKLIMLTATPYNKQYQDLSNQLRLFIDDEKMLPVGPERFIEAIGGPAEFRARYQAEINTILAFEKSDYPEDWSELMRLYLVRRTRSFIKNNYALHDESNGRKYLEFPDGTRSYFPERTPRAVTYTFKRNDPGDQYAQLYSEKVVNKIDDLILPRYGLGQDKYISNSKLKHVTDKEQNIVANLTKAGTRLIGFARTNLFKRLESSGYSFLLSISRHILRNYLFLYAIEHKKPFPIGKQEPGLINAFMYRDEDIEEEAEVEHDTNLLLSHEEYMGKAEKYYDALLLNKKRYKWIDSALFKPKLKKALLHDSELLMDILDIGKKWSFKKDRQLKALYKLITKTHADEKILIFSQFSDTVYYLYDALIKMGVDRIEWVSGSRDDPTELAYKFSPVSNDISPKPKDEIRILITTDVLSEGQNLQDAHLVLNYDLPWAIIRLIQRAGRVDRIGQKHHEIICYSFLPEKGIEDIIKLRTRLSKRIEENAEAVGSDEVFFEGDPINLEDLYNEKAGILDEDEDVEVDLASYAFQIWKNAIDENPKLEKLIPDMPHVVYATKKALPDQQLNGSIVYTKTQRENDVLAWVDGNHKIVTQSQYEILKAAKCEPEEPALERFEKHHALVETGLNHIKTAEDKIGGQLGKKSGARYRVYTRLKQYSQSYDNTLFVTDALKRAIDDIYNYNLREFARETINRMLKTGVNDEDLAATVVSLREDNKLSIVHEDEQTTQEPQIICSLGLKV